MEKKKKKKVLQSTFNFGNPAELSSNEGPKRFDLQSKPQVLHTATSCTYIL